PSTITATVMIRTFDSLSSLNSNEPADESASSHPFPTPLHPIVECSSGTNSLSSLANLAPDQSPSRTRPTSVETELLEQSLNGSQSVRLRRALPPIAVPRRPASADLAGGYDNKAYLEDEEMISDEDLTLFDQPDGYRQHHQDKNPSRQVSFDPGNCDDTANDQHHYAPPTVPSGAEFYDIN